MKTSTDRNPASRIIGGLIFIRVNSCYSRVKYFLLIIALALILCSCNGTAKKPEENVFLFKDKAARILIGVVPGILETFDKETGRFGEGIWISTDQNRIYPLAAAWALNRKDNPYYKNPEVLEAVIMGGNALIDDMDENGQWIFRKKDGSEWGMIRMPWVYTRWIRAFDIIKDAMPVESREKWENALRLGFSNIAEHDMNHVHNIPCHYAMGLYIAGKTINKPE